MQDIATSPYIREADSEPRGLRGGYSRITHPALHTLKLHAQGTGCWERHEAEDTEWATKMILA